MNFCYADDILLFIIYFITFYYLFLIGAMYKIITFWPS